MNGPGDLGGFACWIPDRTFAVFRSGVSLVMLVLLVVINPSQFFSRVPGASALFNLIPLLLDAAKGALFASQSFQFLGAGSARTGDCFQLHFSSRDRLRNPASGERSKMKQFVDSR